MEGPRPDKFYKCFQIVKTQKISSWALLMYGVTVCSERSFAAALSGSPTESVRSWHGITFRRLMQDSRYCMKEAGRSADTTSGFFFTN